MQQKRETKVAFFYQQRKQIMIMKIMISKEKTDKKKKQRRNKIPTTNKLKDSSNADTLFYNSIRFVSGEKI